MTPEAIAFVAAVVLVAVPVWVLFLHVLPSHLCSLFRYKLWRTRDAVVDDVFRGRLPRNDQVGLLLNGIERTIQVSRHFTVFRSRFLPRADSRVLGQIQSTRQAFLDGIDDECRKRYLAHENAFTTAVGLHAFVGSPSGWFAALIVVALFAAILPLAILVGIVKWTLRRAGRAVNWRPVRAVLLPAYSVLFLCLIGNRIAALQTSERPSPKELVAYAGS